MGICFLLRTKLKVTGYRLVAFFILFNAQDWQLLKNYDLINVVEIFELSNFT
jgi:hypothetical protein